MLLVQFLENNKFIDTQNGFRTKRSCLTTLLAFFQGISENWDNFIPSDVIYLEFQIAFDKVPNERLLKKLKSAGIGNNLTEWIKDWLTGRQQRLLLNEHTSG